MRTQANIATPMVRLVRLVDDCEETWRNREIFANSIQQTLDVWLNHFGSELGGQRVVFTWSTWNVPISKRSGALRKVHRRFLTRWENRSISQDTPTHTRSVNFSSWTFIFSHAERTHDCGKEPRRGPSCGPSCGLVFLTLLWTLPDVTNLQSALWFVLCLIACGWIQNASRSHKITSEQCWNIGELTHPSVCVCLISAFNGWTCSTDRHSMILRRMQNSWFLFLLMLWQMLNTGVQLLKPLPPKDTSAINLVLSLNPLPFISLDTSLTTVGSPLCILCNIRSVSDFEDLVAYALHLAGFHFWAALDYWPLYDCHSVKPAGSADKLEGDPVKFIRGRKCNGWICGDMRWLSICSGSRGVT